MTNPEDTSESVLAARSGAVAFRLPDPGLLAVLGEDRVRFLNGMITQDVKALAEGAGKYALLCNAKGKVLADLYVWAAKDFLRIECEAGLLEKIRSTLDHYIIADDVTLEDRTGEAAILHVGGRESASVLKKAGLALPEEPLRRLPARLGEVSVLLARCDRTGLPGYDLWCEPAAAGAALKALEAAGARAAARGAFDLLRLESGIPRYGVDFGEDNLPQEANLKHAFSTTKGCYTGQEVICKIESFAHVSRHLVGFEIEGPLPPPGARIFSQAAAIGSLTQAGPSPTLGKLLALGYVRHKALEDGTDLSALDVRWEGGAARARKVGLPFVPAAGSG